LVRVPAAAALFLITTLASAQGMGDGRGDAATADGEATDAASPAAEAQSPCDGALCATQTGSTCSVPADRPGRSPSLFATPVGLALLATGALLRRAIRSRRRGASCPGSAPDLG